MTREAEYLFIIAHQGDSTGMLGLPTHASKAGGLSQDSSLPLDSICSTLGGIQISKVNSV